MLHFYLMLKLDLGTFIHWEMMHNILIEMTLLQFWFSYCLLWSSIINSNCFLFPCMIKWHFYENECTQATTWYLCQKFNKNFSFNHFANLPSSKVRGSILLKLSWTYCKDSFISFERDVDFLDYAQDQIHQQRRNNRYPIWACLSKEL